MGGLSFRHSYNSISHPAAPGRSRYKPSLISPLSVCLVDTSVAQHRGHNGNVRPVLVAQHSALCHVSANLFRLFILLYELPARVLCLLLTVNSLTVFIFDDCQLQIFFLDLKYFSSAAGRVAFEKLTDLDYKGETYYTIRNLSLYECQGWCREEPECQAASFSFVVNPLTPRQVDTRDILNI